MVAPLVMLAISLAASKAKEEQDAAEARGHYSENLRQASYQSRADIADERAARAGDAPYMRTAIDHMFHSPKMEQTQDRSRDALSAVGGFLSKQQTEKDAASAAEDNKFQNAASQGGQELKLQPYGDYEDFNKYGGYA